MPAEWRGTADSYDELNIYYRCITRGLLGSVIPVIYGNGNEIVQAPGYVAVHREIVAGLEPFAAARERKLSRSARRT